MKFFNSTIAAVILLGLSGCVVAPQQPLGYRMTSATLPTYVNGQYIGMQPSNYMPPASTVTAADAAPPTAPAVVAAPSPSPVYIQSATPSVVYIQAPTPVYSYSPYYYPGYVDPFFSFGLGWGIGSYGRWGAHWGGRGHWRH